MLDLDIFNITQRGDRAGQAVRPAADRPDGLQPDPRDHEPAHPPARREVQLLEPRLGADRAREQSPLQPDPGVDTGPRGCCGSSGVFFRGVPAPTLHGGNLLYARTHSPLDRVLVVVPVARRVRRGRKQQRRRRPEADDTPTGRRRANPCTTALLADSTGTGDRRRLAGDRDVRRQEDRSSTAIPRGRADRGIGAEPLGRGAAAQPRRSGPRSKRRGWENRGPPSPRPRRSQKTSAISPSSRTPATSILPLNPYDVRSIGLRFTRNGSSYTLSKIDGTFRSDARHAAHARRRRQRAGEHSVLVPVLRHGADRGVRQLRRQHHARRGGQVEHRAQHRPPGHRPAPHRAVLRGPRPDDGHRPDLRERRRRSVYTVTWCNVARLRLDAHDDGAGHAPARRQRRDESSSDGINIAESIVGISPGPHERRRARRPDGRERSGRRRDRRALRAGELASTPSRVAKKFYATHPDNFDQILLWTDQPLIRDAFAYELTIANDVRGIGQDILRHRRGSPAAAGRLQLAGGDGLARANTPDDPTPEVSRREQHAQRARPGSRPPLAGATSGFRDRTGTPSTALLGRDDAHWSFFFDSDASVMEGNDIEDLGGGQFRTIDAVKRYSRLDQYMMGLVPPGSVPTFFYVESPVSTKIRSDAPSIGVSFTGTRRDVLVEDIIAVNGPRAPVVRRISEGPSPGLHLRRQQRPLARTAGRWRSSIGSARSGWRSSSRRPRGRMTADTRLRWRLSFAARAQLERLLRLALRRGRRAAGISGSSRWRGGGLRRRRSISASAGRSAAT